MYFLTRSADILRENFQNPEMADPTQPEQQQK